MLLWLALGVFAAAALVAGRWLFTRVDSLGRSRSFPVASVVVLAVLGAGMLVPVVRHDRLESRLGEVATELVGAPATVRCQTAGEQFVDAGPEAGYVRYGPDGVPEQATLLKRAQCKYLRSYLGSDKAQPSRGEVIAVHVLSHEARHMAGVTDEVRAECGAMQRDAWAAQLLGATPDQASRLARTYWRVVYPSMRSTYRSPECAAGGELDEHLTGAPWGAG